MLCLWQGWEFALSLICSSIFRSKLLILKSNCEQFTHVAHYKRATVSDLLRLLITKERPWSIHSRWSLQKSNREQFAHITLYKWATMSKLLSLHFKKEQCEWFERIAWKKQAICFKYLYFSYVFDSCSPFYAQGRIAPVAHHSFALFLRVTSVIRSRCSLQKSNREWFAQFVHDKKANVSDSLMLQWQKSNRSNSLFLWAKCSFAHKNEQIARKTDERIPNPGLSSLEIFKNLWLSRS